MPTTTEENYLKAVFKIAEKSDGPVSTTRVAELMETTPASVTDMLKRLSEKDLLNYARYKGVSLTEEGERIAKTLIRKHRLWEVFLFEKLNFGWDEVHDIAEQLEHIQSKTLTRRLEAFLDYPKVDPHGDPIPDESGNIKYPSQVLLKDLKVGVSAIVTGVAEHSPAFLRYLDQAGLTLGAEVQLIEVFEFDQSARLKLNGQKELTVSNKISSNIYVNPK